jgi:LysM repeat protein
MPQRSYRLLLVLLFLFVVAAPLSAAAQPPLQDGTYYVVKQGDTLSRIAARLGVSVAELARVNGITNTNFVYVGQRLQIPKGKQVPAQASVTEPVPGATPAPNQTPAKSIVVPIAPVQTGAAPAATGAPRPTEAPAPDQNQGGSKIHIVQRGDTLSKIAARYGVSVRTLMAANKLRNANLIYTGQRLVIPGAKPAPKPTPAPTPVPVPTAQPAEAPTAQPAEAPTAQPAEAPTAQPAAAPTAQPAAAPTPQPGPAPTAQPGPTPTAKPGAAPTTSPSPAPDAAADRWIDVNLTTQTLVAYEGQKPIFTTLVSSGLPRTPTVVGKFKIYTKLAATTMSGPGYFLPNVPYTMYFHGSYGIHGTYWHNNFGHPMSHGCVNVSTPDAAWLFGWASVGTPVVTHY